jgi:hypothetical protein
MTRDELIVELERRGKSSNKAMFRWVPDRILDEWRAMVLAERLRRRRLKISIPEPPKLAQTP